MARLQGHRPLEPDASHLMLAAPAAATAQVVAHVGSGGVQQVGAQQAGLSRVALPLGQQHHAQVGVENRRLRQQLNGAADQRQRRLGPALLVAQKAQQMVGIGMVGVGRQQLAVQRLGHRPAASLVMVQRLLQRVCQGCHGSDDRSRPAC